MYLPDINFWLALSFEAHVHHQTALAWFQAQEIAPIAFCRFTQQGFFRLATNPIVFGDEAMTMSLAWNSYDMFLGDERIYFSDEPSGLESLWRKHTKGFTYSPKVWSDAYLAAFAEASDALLVTFDQGFSSYKGVKTTMLNQ